MSTPPNHKYLDPNATFGVVIMAAGKGTRLKSKRPKVLHEVGGRSLLLHVIEAAKTIAAPSNIYCVVGHEAARVRAAVEHTGVHFVLQAEQRGTGHALQQVKALFLESGQTPPDNLLVLSGDVPLISPETLSTLKNIHLGDSAAMTILTAVPPDPTGYGRIFRKDARSREVVAIVEQKDLPAEELSAPEINSGIYCFQTSELFEQLDKLSSNNAQGELYLTDVATLLSLSRKRVAAVEAKSADEVLGANTIAEMMQLDALLRLQTARKLMSQGVTIFRPETCAIDASVEVGPDTVIEPYVQLLGSTRVGTECRIRSYSVLQDSLVGNGVLIRNGCVLDQAEVGDDAFLGPYAHLRPESQIGQAAHIGNFVETKKARIGNGSKANHLSYLGDAVIGEGVNVGAGVITCNYDGVHKNQTTIGDRSFVGSDATLVAPLTIGDDVYVAAASCITEDVPSGALALGRSRQTNKPGWVAKRRSQQLSDASEPDVPTELSHREG